MYLYIYVGLTSFGITLLNFIFSLFPNPIYSYICFYMLKTYNYFLNNEIIVTGNINNIKNQQFIFVSNHYDGVDFPVLYEALSNPYNKYLKTIAKSDLAVPHSFGLLGKIINNMFLKSLNLIPYERGNKESGKNVLNNVKVYLNENKNTNLLVFPEGESKVGGEITSFKPGIFKFAAEHQICIVPITIFYSHFKGTNKGDKRPFDKWFGNKVYIKIHDIIRPSSYDSMLSKAFNSILKQIEDNKKEV